MALPAASIVKDGPTNEELEQIRKQFPIQAQNLASPVVGGIINTAGSGSIVAGSGFTIARNGTGDVTITFTAAFSDVPAITAMAGETNAAIMVKHSPSSSPTKESCRLIVFNTASELKDAIFHFHAIGPR